MNIIRKTLILLILIFTGYVYAIDDKTREYPYFASLGSNNINVRTGPGIDYPIKWSYKQRNLPVEVLEKSENWNKVRDFSGQEGWILGSSLKTGKRYAMVLVDSILYSDKNQTKVKLELKTGVITEIIECNDKKVCDVSLNRTSGYILKKNLWGVYINETILK